ncbi:hypothetical protein A1O1_07102 [Capronia coronata CBS 617.96]|uniref:Uncharacterized protein n=1 Tax=Capronia coronata CBS 617.96 TaxID=1182541 RepID=W9YMI5_9EURO|nr:uncharacterized protein A1O1_07102 [Capronia coronata CBS 617.96]EXJ83479.1 hypothetical protein A1O1_07102 [Capronia coronata CBS 617.96]
MSLALDVKTLEDVAESGEMDYDKWPSMIEPLLQRLNQIVYTEFPTPRPYPNITRPPPSSSPTQARDANIGDQRPSTPVRNLPPVPPFPNSSASRVPDSLPPSQDLPSDSSNELPGLLLQLFNSVTHTLRTSFSEKPPHTIQRLAELVLYPTKHYSTLPAWLRAVDRVVSVSSTADVFPLSDTPAIVNGVNGDGGGGILWNNSDNRNGYDNNSLGSDESLGGALLTPIPWLRNGNAGEDSGEESAHLDSHDDSSTDGMGSLSSDRTDMDPMVPERADGAVTQGELMRMEQEAGVVPAAQNPQHTNAGRTMAGAEEGLYMDDEDGEDAVPHARGPDVVGTVDMGRVDGHEVQIRIGSPPDGDNKTADPNNAQTVLPSQDPAGATSPDVGASSLADSEDFEIVLKDTAENAEADGMQLDNTGASADRHSEQPSQEQDGDIVLVDADGKTEDESASKTDVSGENVGADAVDTSTVT